MWELFTNKKWTRKILIKERKEKNIAYQLVLKDDVSKELRMKTRIGTLCFGKTDQLDS